jgi:hypothetical protein
MAVFPTFPEIDCDLQSDNPLVDEVRFKTSSTMFGIEGQERRKRGLLYPKRDMNLKFTWITKQEARLLWEFYVARSGSLEPFYYVHPFESVYEVEFASVTDGASVNFLVPSIGATNYFLRIAGSGQAEPTDYVFHSQGGLDGLDYVELINAVGPSNPGDVLTWSFTGQLVTRCRFDKDVQKFETFYDRLAKMGIKLKGLLFSDEFGFGFTTTSTTTSTT